MVEIMIALVVFTVSILAMTATSFHATQTLRLANGYTAAAAAAQWKLDSLTAVGWAALGGQSGADTVQGYPVTWNVQGTDPRKVILVVTRQVTPTARADTFVTYVAEVK